MRIFVSGSLAYDRIMVFPGRFGDHILPQKIHILNVCFNISGLTEKFGGTAGNIAYTLRCLGERPNIVAAAGEDFARYEKRLADLDLPREWIMRVPGVLTAGAYITTDKDDNQITAFNMGAMAHPCPLPPLDGAADGGSLVLIGPGNRTDMANLAEKCRREGAGFVFDPGQSLNIWSGPELREAVAGALAFISNEYELSLFLQMTGWEKADLLAQAHAVITTAGPEGSVLDRGGETARIPAVSVADVRDPTGAGDSYRAGLLKGLATGRSWETSCRMGAVAAAYAVEHHGTQEHVFTWEDFQRRFEAAFGALA